MKELSAKLNLPDNQKSSVLGLIDLKAGSDMKALLQQMDAKFDSKFDEPDAKFNALDAKFDNILTLISILALILAGLVALSKFMN